MRGTKKAKRVTAKAPRKKIVGRGRPPKASSEKYVPIAIRLHPDVLSWAKKEGSKLGVGYQTVINQVLLRRSK